MMNAIPPQHPKYRTKLCRNFTSGNCPFGSKCSFLHPAPLGLNPLSLSIAQYLFNWNTFLPQLLALSNQQETLKNMQQQSSPRTQGPQLVDEDPSPATSLLLSASDCTSLEQMPETGRSSKRKKYPCKQFIRTGGWCPAGAKCRFHHDVATLPCVDGRKVRHASPPDTDSDVPRDVGRTISGGVLMGTQLPSPPDVTSEYLESPQYTEAESVQSYQTWYWPGYAWQSYQPYYATIPATAAAPVSATMPASSAIQSSTYHPPPQSPVQNIPPAETQTSLPMGAYEVNGTTYFPTQTPSVPAPAPVTCSVPVRPDPYSRPMPQAYPCYAPPPVPSGYVDVSRLNSTMDVDPQTSFDPFSSDRMVSRDLSVISQLEDYHLSPLQRDDHLHPLSSPLVLPEDATTNTKATKNPEFPYRPPKNQQVGHARRISVNIKKHASVNSG